MGASDTPFSVRVPVGAAVEQDPFTGTGIWTISFVFFGTCLQLLCAYIVLISCGRIAGVNDVTTYETAMVQSWRFFCVRVSCVISPEFDQRLAGLPGTDA
ncbi:hypothetical protein EMIT0P74_220083 [Pseudomonas sp. IT-P74]